MAKIPKDLLQKYEKAQTLAREAFDEANEAAKRSRTERENLEKCRREFIALCHADENARQDDLVRAAERCVAAGRAVNESREKFREKYEAENRAHNLVNELHGQIEHIARGSE